MNSIPLKRCTNCGREYDSTVEFFPSNKKLKSGLDSWCRKCHCQQAKTWQKQHPELRRKKGNEWYKKNREYANRKRRERRKKHREEINTKRRLLYAENPEKVLVAHRSYYSEHREQEREKHRAYRKNNPIKANSAKQRNRAQKHGLPNTFSDLEARVALVYWQWKCVYCGVSLIQLNMFEDIKTHFDHFIPITDLRFDNPGTVKENMLPSCAKCNQSKFNHEPIGWITRKFGKRKATRLLLKIEAYFNS